MKTLCSLNRSGRGNQSALSHRIPSNPQAPYYDFDILFMRQGSVFGLVSLADVAAALEETDIYVLLCSRDPQASTSCFAVQFLGRLTGMSEEFTAPGDHAAHTFSAVMVSRPGQYGTSFAGAGGVVTWNWLSKIYGWGDKLVIRPAYDKLFLTPDASLPGPNITTWSIHDTQSAVLYKMKAIAQEEVWNTTQIDFTARASSKFAFTASVAYSDALVLNHLTLTTDEGEMRVDVPLFSLLGFDSSANNEKLLWSCLVMNVNMTTLAPAIMAMGAPGDASTIWDGTKFSSEYSGLLTFTALGASRNL